MFGNRTDLALEAHEIYCKQAKKYDEIPGIRVDNSVFGDIGITRVTVSDKVGAQALGKEIGTYITLEAEDLMYNAEVYENMCYAIAEQIKALSDISDKSVILVVGLGNESITPDALGPKTVSKLMITRHLKEYIPQYTSENMRAVCAVAAGVLGTTGIESTEIIRAVADRIKPDIIIAVDALASNGIRHINKTFQITDTGITPGEGIGNRRAELNRTTLGIPVIAIGVPTVIDAVTIANNSIDAILKKYIGTDFGEDIDRQKLIFDELSENVGKLIVTPTDADKVTDKLSKTIANGINLALHKDFTLEDIQNFVE